MVSIADTPDAYIAACEKILARDIDAQRRHAADLAQAISLTSWDKTAQAMVGLIEQADRAKDVPEADEAQPETLAKVA